MRKRALSFLMVVILVLSLLPAAVMAASDYTSVSSGTVSWQMIEDNPNTYYWMDSDGDYCALTATKSGSNYYVTLYRPSKGSELRYLRQDKSDDSGSAHEWSSASAKYTGGILYVKNGSSTGESSSGDSGGSGGNTSDTIADGTYEADGRVTFSKDDYTFHVVVTVSGGKITNITQKITSSVKKSDSETEYQPEALTALKKNLVGKDATVATVDAVSSGTPKYSYAALKSAVSEALGKGTTSGDEPGGSSTGDGNITNPATVTENNLSLSKNLSYDSASSTYTLTLTGYAMSAAGGTYQVDGYDKKYSFSQLCSGNYYYKYIGTFYPVSGLKYYSNDKGKYYYVGYFKIGNTTYYLDKTPQAYSSRQLDKEHPGDDDPSKAYESCKQKDLSDGEELPLYTMTGSGTSIGKNAVLKDTVNTDNFDASSATLSVSPSSATSSFNRTTGVLTVSNYDYSGNYNGTKLTVTIAGLKAKSSGDAVTSNVGKAGIYADSSAGTALVSISVCPAGARSKG